MNSALLKIFHGLPAPARSILAGLQGSYLRRWRYGPETGRLIEEALEREQWTSRQWKDWQEARLAGVLHRAATRVPYYREYWAARRRKGGDGSWQHLENWPILTKDALRENPRAFVADDCDIRRMFHEHTSGTSGTPLDLWRSRETVRSWYALFEARCRHWNGLSRHDRWAILGGQLVTPASQRRPPFWVWNRAFHQLYLSSFHLAKDLVPHYLEALHRYQIRYLLGYTSSLYALAQEILRQGRRDIQMTVVLTNAEPVFDYQRKAIAAAFQCPVRESYGMAEIVAAASECGSGRLHLWPEAGWVEVLQQGQKAPPGTSGDLVCTSLLNADMPLIRYRVGDRGALPEGETPCSCGRLLPALEAVEGRVDDLVYTADGRQIGRLDPVFKDHLPVCEAQIIQEALQRLRIRYVPSAGFSEAWARSMVERLRDRVGLVEVVLEPVEQIPREANGKFRAVVCKLSPQERAAVGGLTS